MTTKTFYVASTTTTRTPTSASKALSLSVAPPNAESNMGQMFPALAITLDDPNEFADFTVGTEVTLTLTPVAPVAAA